MTNRNSARPPAVSVLIDNCRGVYIPKDFVDGYDLSFNRSDIDNTGWQGIDAADVETCRDPHNEDYWNAWQSIIDNAVYTDEFGDSYRLYHDGDLFVYCLERMTHEEKLQFGFC